MLGRKPTRAIFEWPMSEGDTVSALTAAYRAEVAWRRGEFSADAGTAANIGRMAAFLTGSGRAFGAMLCGAPGNGKTTLLLAFQSLVNWMSDTGRFAGGARPSVRIADALEIAAKARDPKAFGELRGAELLGIEDMGREPREVMDYGSVLSPVTDLLEHRYNRRMFTVITTNLTKRQIREKYGARIADRLNEMLEVIVFRNGTYRKAGGEGAL